MIAKMYMRKLTFKYYIRFSLLYLLILASIFLVVGRQDNAAILTGDFNSTRTLDLYEILSYFIYQYVLNFPLSIFNWFTERYLYTTFFFALPNSLIMAWIIGKLLPGQRKEISKMIYYGLITCGIFLFTAISYLFITNIFGQA